MATFTKLYKALTLNVQVGQNVVPVEIFKVVKDGTKREFFSPEINGKRFTKTMFARMSEAERISASFVRSKK